MAVCAFYRSRRVLVTGLTGFKGVWLARWLEHLGAEVTGLALPPTDAMSRSWPGLAGRFTWEPVDVRDGAAVARVFASYRPEVVFHLAAQPLVRLSYEEPVATFATNVLGTAHVLEAARQTPSVRALVSVTSDKCYENREWCWGYRECDPLGGHDPYSASKSCAEIVTSCYQRSFGRPDRLVVASARAGNVIGGGDWAADRLVPDMIRGILANQPVILRRPEAQRPWQHVLEPLSGYLTLGAALGQEGARQAGAWNFGPPDADTVTVRDLAEMLVRAWGRGEVVLEPVASGPHETRYLKLDSSKAAAELGWRPLLSVAHRVGWTVEWYQTWQRDPQAIWDLTGQQIARYQERTCQCPSLAARWFQESPASSAPPSRAA
jgi:CDP-glucose 4,6-dehydratase